MNLETEIKQIKADVEYIKKMVEDLTMMLSANADAKQMLAGQMGVLKNMFVNMPGLSPDIKAQMGQIFDQVGT